MVKQCSLCALEVPKNPVVDGDKSFCCSGCLTVFNIVGADKEFRSHPLFQEALQAGIISNPHLQEEISNATPEKESQKYHLQVDDMWCSSCAEAIRLILLRQKGISRCVIDYATDLGVIEYNPCLIGKEQIRELIRRLGYRPSELLSSEKNRISRSLWLRFGVAVFCTLNIMMFSYPLYTAHFGVATEGYENALGWLSLALALPLITYCAFPIWRRLKVSLKSRLFGMETLVFISVSTAFITSLNSLLIGSATQLYFDSMAMVISFILLGRILEKKAKFSAKETLFRLTHALPKRGYKKMPSGEYAYVPVKDISCGDTLLVRTGEKIILDGEVIEGSGLVDEAVMTGEAVFKQKKEGSVCIGGSVLKQGMLSIKVSKDHTESLIGKIVSLIENDLSKKNQTERFVDRITHYFVPVVLGLATLACLYSGPVRALTVLLIACPCALGIAAPLALSRLLFRFAENGALVRNRHALSLLAKDPFFVFDKTGTLTQGKFQVQKMTNSLTSHNLGILKALVSSSIHPISLAIQESVVEKPADLEKVEEIVGRGIEGLFQGKRYLLGSERFCHERGISVPSYQTTVVYFVEDQTLLTEVHLGDQLRSRLPHVEGVVLSGDSPELVAKIAKKCGFLWGKGGLDPLQKREEILKLKREKELLVMVGDGINDAPAMTAADLGISVVSATDLAVEVSDILLTTEHLDALPKLGLLAKRGRRIIRQNLFWAFFYNGVGILLALFGLLNPLFAALAMVTSSLFVTLNSLRIS